MNNPYIGDAEFKPHHFGLALFSDLHIGATDIEEAKLKDDLGRSAQEDRRILINGDVIEGILPTDRKRYTPSVAESNRNDVLNEQTEHAYKILKPYADYIDVIGIGNHEVSLLKYASYDIVSAIIFLLSKDRSKTLKPIHRAGYQGYIRYHIMHKVNGKRNAFTIYHHHGSGGNSPVTKGMIDFNRVVYSHEANLFWLGHKHSGVHDPYIVRDRVNAKGNYEKVVSQAIFTPGYKKSANVDGDHHYSDGFYSMQANGYAVVDIYADSKNHMIKNFEVISR